MVLLVECIKLNDDLWHKLKSDGITTVCGKDTSQNSGNTRQPTCPACNKRG